MQTRYAWALLAGLAASAWTGAATAQAPRTPAPPGAELYFITPKNGDVITGDVVVRFGLKGMGVAPAGSDVAKTGHHHLLIDVAQLPKADQPIPNDETHRHFGGGQTETTLKLPPGKHTLQLMLGDKNHIPFDPPVVSQQITITVK